MQSIGYGFKMYLDNGAKISKIIDEFGGAKELYNLGETEWRMSRF